MHWSFNSIPNQEGKIVFVTGANSGIGFDTSQALLEKGATVILGCRSLEKAQIARKKLLERTDCGQIYLQEIELSDLENVEKAIDEVTSKYQKIDLLINNAGVMAPPRSLSKQGFEIQFAVNHLSHMALTLKVLPLLVNSKKGRVVTVSSGAQYFGKMNWNDVQGAKNYNRWASYSQSKLANVMFALELDNRAKRSNLDISSIAAHPGLARTNLQARSVKANGSWPEAIAYRLMGPLFQSSRMGALPQLFAATNPEAKSGEQYGPRFNFRGHPSICQVASLALSNVERERLWEVSCKLIGDFVDVRTANELLS